VVWCGGGEVRVVVVCSAVQWCVAGVWNVKTQTVVVCVVCGEVQAGEQCRRGRQ